MLKSKQTSNNGVMYRLFYEYEDACRSLEARIELLTRERSQYPSRSEGYRELYNRIRRLKRCLEDTRDWQRMVFSYLVAGGEADEEMRLLVR